MLRIRGSIGDWPVDLTLEMDDADWARLGAQLQVEKNPVSVPAAKPLLIGFPDCVPRKPASAPNRQR